MKRSLAIIATTVAMFSLNAASCEPVPPVLPGFESEAPTPNQGCPNVNDCLPAPATTTTVDQGFCYEEACADERPDPACPSVSDCLPPTTPPTTEPTCGIENSNPCP